MEIASIIGVGIIGTLLSVLVRTYRSELGICTALATTAVIMAMCIPQIKTVLEGIYALCEEASIDTRYFKSVLKIIAIAYLVSFAAETAKDAGEGAIAKKLELAGKSSVLVIILPIISELIEVILSALSEI